MKEEQVSTKHPSFIEMWSRFQMEQQAEKAIQEAETDEINSMWQQWDGTSLMKLNGVYIPDSWVVAELLKRGVDPGI